MMKLNRFLAFTLAMLMILSTMSFNVFAGEEVKETVEINGDSTSLQDAVNKADKNKCTTIVLRANVTTGSGVIVPEGSNIVIDLNGNTYTADKPTVGSTGTETNGFQLLKNSKVTIKNGIIESDTAKILIQNYCDLTLDNVNLIGGKNSQYVISNNCGDTKITNHTSITAKDGQVAFDVCVTNNYPAGARVTVDTDGTITGRIQYDSWGVIPDTNKTSLTITNGNFVGKFDIEEELVDAAKDKFTITGGTFSSDSSENPYSFDPTAYLTDGYRAVKADGKWSVEEKTADNAVVEKVNLEQGETTGSVSEGIDESLKAVAESVSITSGSAINITDSIKQADMDNYIKEAREDDNFDFETEDLFVHQKPYLKVNVDKYDSTEHILTLDITPYVDIYVSTTNDSANLDESNSKIFKEEKVETTKNIKLTIQLPEGFADVGQTVYINHKELYGYTTKVAEGNSITFTSKGLSPFQISTQPFIYDLNVTNGTVYINDGPEKDQTPSAVSAENGTNTTTKAAIGTNVIVIPAKAEEGMVFDKWEVVEGNVTPSAISGYPTGTGEFIMPGQNVTLKAVYSASKELEEHSITVTNGAAYVGENETKVTEATSGTAITIKPDTLTDKEFIKWEVVNGNVSLKDATSKKTTFIMPDEDVELKATYKSTSSGGGSGSSSSGSTTEEVIEPTNTLPFTDINYNAYYIDALRWAVENSITNGTTATTFSPNMNCTRAQMITFLWRAKGSEIVEEDVPFTDVDKDAYYYDALKWAVKNNITKGIDETTFGPDVVLARAQVVTFMWRLDGMDKVSTSNTFTDVDKDAYYYDAVLWAADNDITNGTSATTFSPDNACTRAQIVTFLYRFVVGK